MRFSRYLQLTAADSFFVGKGQSIYNNDLFDYVVGITQGSNSRPSWPSYFFSCFQYKVLKVSYCDRSLSGMRCNSSVNIFSSVTSWLIGLKLRRKHPLNALTIIPSIYFIQQNSGFHCNQKKKTILLQNRLVDFQIILQKCSLGHPLSDSLELCCLVQKHGRHGQGLFCFIWLQ